MPSRPVITQGFRALFSSRVKAAMNASGLGVKDWAQVHEMPYGTVSHIRNGYAIPSLERAAELASKLDVTLDWLCGETDEGGPDASPKS